MIEVLAGAVIAIAVTILVENWRRRELRLLLIPTPTPAQYPDGRPARSGRYVGLNLHNAQLPWIARWMSRDAALQCHGSITFHHLDGQDVFGRAMPIRWAQAPEPV